MPTGALMVIRLSSSTEELVVRAQEGEEAAAEAVVKRCAGFVARSAFAYSHSSDEFDDLQQEGRLGVLHAIRRFKKSKGCTFSTYAPFWINQYVQRAARRGREIKLPVNISAAGPTAYQTLDAPISDTNSTTQADTTPDETFLSDPADLALAHEEHARLEAALQKLAPKARRMIDYYYGFSGEALGFSEIGQREGCSRQNVHQSLKRFAAMLRRELGE
jgi:RNA polymerase sigma factor (sigma-70 family)